MLAVIRRFARSWVFKGLLLVLVLSFAVWGIGDVFTGGSSGVVARAGEEAVTASELDERFRLRLQQIQQQSAQPLTRADAIRFGLLDETLQGLIAARLLEAEARSLGLTTADATVGRLIRSDPSFAVNGSFDRARFDNILRQSGLDEELYSEDVRREQTRAALVGAIRPVTGLPTALTAPLAERLAEQRSGQLLVVADQRFVGDVAEPDDDALITFLEANPVMFRAPERRDVSAVLLDARTLAAEIDVDEAELQELYDAESARFTTPEQRTVMQLRGDDETAVREAHTLLQGGMDADDVVGRVAGVSLSPLGDVARDALPEDFGNAIFAAGGPGSVTAPVQSAFGWHVFLVEAVIPSQISPLADVRDDLAARVALERAAAELPDLATALDDAIGGGSTLEDAAAGLDLPLVTLVDLDRDGRSADGETYAELDAFPGMLAEAFTASEGEVSLLGYTDDGGAYVFRVDEVRPAHTQTLDEARGLVETAWRAEEARRLAMAAGENARLALAGGEAAIAVAERLQLELRTVEPQTRTDDVADASVRDALFVTAPGGVAEELVQLSDGAGVLVVDAAISQADEVHEAALREADAGLARDLLIQFELALRERHPVTIDQRALTTYFPAQ
ncbi:MAG: SurA N-terminal domain-containing protein [Pseudomonadota bacterium]